MAKEATKTTAQVTADLEKKYGKGTIQSLNSSIPLERIGSISTGSSGLNRAIGVGGVPVGRMTEIVGPESSGKTTIATHILKEAQLKEPDKMQLIVDVEHTYDFIYAEKIGLNRDRIKFAQPGHGEESFDILKSLIRTGDFNAALLDSVAANIPKEQHEGETGQSRMARLAALMSMELPKLVPIIANTNCAMIFLNQFRNNIGGYGNPEKAAGGEALKYYTSVRIDIRKTAEKANGRNETRAKVFKNKVAPPLGEATFYIDWGYGINHTMEILEDAIDMGFISVGGSWYTLEGETKLQGEDKVLQFFYDNPGLVAHYETLVSQTWAGGFIAPKKEKKEATT